MEHNISFKFGPPLQGCQRLLGRLLLVEDWAMRRLGSKDVQGLFWRSDSAAQVRVSRHGAYMMFVPEWFSHSHNC
jgi:hypothetical protein